MLIEKGSRQGSMIMMVSATTVDITVGWSYRTPVTEKLCEPKRPKSSEYISYFSEVGS